MTSTKGTPAIHVALVVADATNLIADLRVKGGLLNLLHDQGAATKTGVLTLSLVGPKRTPCASHGGIYWINSDTATEAEPRHWLWPQDAHDRELNSKLASFRVLPRLVRPGAPFLQMRA